MLIGGSSQWLRLLRNVKSRWTKIGIESVLESRAGQDLALDTELPSRTGPRSRSKLTEKSADIEDEIIHSMSTGAKPGARLNNKKKLLNLKRPTKWTNYRR
ncbi:hypothetical protein EVAR_53697_1 [Eumeta japonica]|uniref:Uncharacterized protein n=1 Tax=Eumeta variegata TaxID=151549 RepID=A0A4C1Z8V1_EUMVA|nr:hypothetical protein EVAR_53697_1 [Eumeta japonica]